MSPSAAVAEQLTQDELERTYGYIFWNPAPKSSLTTVIGGHTVPFGSVGVEVCGTWYILKPQEPFTLKHNQPHAQIIVAQIIQKIGEFAAKDMGIRPWDVRQVVEGSVEQANAHIDSLDTAGKEALADTLDFIQAGIDQDNEERKNAKLAPRGPTRHERMHLAFRDALRAGLKEREALTEDQQIAAIKVEAAAAPAAHVVLEEMSMRELHKRAKKLDVKGLKFGATKDTLIAAIKSVEAERGTPFVEDDDEDTD